MSENWKIKAKYTAKLILEKLKRNSDAFRQIVERMALVADALIKLAYLPLPPNQQVTNSIFSLSFCWFAWRANQ